MKPSPSLCATRSMKACGTRGDPGAAGRPGVPGVLAALLQRHRPLVHGAGRAAEHEDAVPGQQRHGRVAHLLHRRPRARGVVDRALVLVDDDQRAAPERGALVEDRRQLAQVRPHRAEERMVVHGPARRPGAACAARGAAGSRAGPASRPSTTRPSRSMRSTWEGRSSAQVSSHGLHSSVPSPRLTVMCPARWSL